MCGPRGLQGEPDHLFHNNGDGTFTDVSEKAGVSDPSALLRLLVHLRRINNDGKVDLLVADDSSPNYLYINKGDGTFEDDSFASGFALNENGRETASMGLAVGDYRNNGRLGLFNTTFSDDYKSLYRNDGDANFTDDSYAAGHCRADCALSRLGDRVHRLRQRRLEGSVRSSTATSTRRWTRMTGAPRYAAAAAAVSQPMHGKKFELMPAGRRHRAWPLVIPARGAAFGDLFNDGRIDVVINNMDQRPGAAAQREPRPSSLGGD